MSALNDLHQSVILDHGKHPRNRRRLPAATRVATGDNPACGDHCTVYLRLEGARVAEITFEGAGCAISQASASLMTTLLKGQTAAGAAATFGTFSAIVKTGRAPGEFCEMAAFAGLHAFPARVKCATLAWHAALDALRQPDCAPASNPDSK